MLLPTDQQLNDTVGNPLLYLGEDGRPSVNWEKLLTTIPLVKPLVACWNKGIVITRVKCNLKISSFLKSALDDVLLDPEVGPTINDYGGCYEFRMQRKSTTMLSRHSWGTAIDLDVADNPFGREPKVHPKTVEIFNKYGFAWGGLFKGTRKDGMHFEFYDLGRL